MNAQERKIIGQAIEQIVSVTCDPEGVVVIKGSQGDRNEVQFALTALRTLLEQKESVEPVAYEFRMKADWNDCWGTWAKCTEEQANDYEKTTKLHDWSYEVRRLYTALPTPSVPMEEVREMVDALGCFSGKIHRDACDLIERLAGITK